MSECLGIYILSTQILKKIESKSKLKDVNLSYDVLQDLSKLDKVSAFDIGEKPWIDVKSPVTLEINKKVVNQIIKQME
jgi:mannose-1-phosphate guanylyltransferase